MYYTFNHISRSRGSHHVLNVGLLSARTCIHVYMYVIPGIIGVRRIAHQDLALVGQLLTSGQIKGGRFHLLRKPGVVKL